MVRSEISENLILIARSEFSDLTTAIVGSENSDLATILILKKMVEMYNIASRWWNQNCSKVRVF